MIFSGFPTNIILKVIFQAEYTVVMDDEKSKGIYHSNIDEYLWYLSYCYIKNIDRSNRFGRFVQIPMTYISWWELDKTVAKHRLKNVEISFTSSYCVIIKLLPIDSAKFLLSNTATIVHCTMLARCEWNNYRDTVEKFDLRT